MENIVTNTIPENEPEERFNALSQPTPEGPKMPTTSEIFKKCMDIRNSDKIKVEDIRTWMLKNTLLVKNQITKFFEETDFREDPEVCQDRLHKFHMILAGMSGLADGLYERAVFLQYKELTEESRDAAVKGRQKLTAGDREVYARGEVSDIKALRKDLEETLSNLEMRSTGWKMASSKKW